MVYFILKGEKNEVPAIKISEKEFKKMTNKIIIKNNDKRECKMKNKLSDLNNHLFEELERLNDEDLTQEQMEKEIERSKAMANIAKNIIDNAKTILDASKFINETGYDISSTGTDALKLLGIETDEK